MFTEQKKALTICVVAIALNTALSLLAKLFCLPMWLDTVGTIYAAIILGFPYGFVVGLINNVFWAVLTEGHNSFAYYVVSLAVAYMAAKLTSRSERPAPLALAKLFIALFAVGAILASATTIIVDAGVPTDYWGQVSRLFLIENGLAEMPSCILAVSAVKAVDTLVSLLLVAIAIAATPVKYLDAKYVLK